MQDDSRGPRCRGLGAVERALRGPAWSPDPGRRGADVVSWGQLQAWREQRLAEQGRCGWEDTEERCRLCLRQSWVQVPAHDDRCVAWHGISPVAGHQTHCVPSWCLSPEGG